MISRGTRRYLTAISASVVALGVLVAFGQRFVAEARPTDWVMLGILLAAAVIARRNMEI